MRRPLEPIVPGRPDLLAEVVYAARREQARTVGDVLLRRTRLGLTAARLLLASDAVIERVAGVMGAELGLGRRAPRARGRRVPRRGPRRRHPARHRNFGPPAGETRFGATSPAARPPLGSEPLDLEPLCHAV